MIYNFFITISFLIIASLCNAMESNNKLDILAELTGITNPLKAQYITNDHIAVSGIGGCTIVNLKTKEAKKLQGSYCAHLDVDRDNKKIVFSHNQVIKVCDGQTGTQKWSQVQEHSIKCVAFNPLKKAIYICSQKSLNNQHDFEVAIQAYSTSKYVDCMSNIRWEGQSSGVYRSVIAFHPTQEIMCIGRTSGISLYALAGSVLQPKEIELFHGECNFCKYSPDGSLIASGNEYYVAIIDPNENKKKYVYWDKGAEFKKIAFYSKGMVLATLAHLFEENHCVIRYWDVKTSQLIYEMPRLSVVAAYDICFSPDAKSVLLALHDRCVILPVPFEVMYESDTKERFPHLLFLLDQLEHNNELPQDITYCFRESLLATFKR